MAKTSLQQRDLGGFDPEQDVLDLYLREVSRTPLLTAEQERRLAERARDGDELALQELVTRNLRFVISVAKKYRNRGLPLVDLIGEGNMGLLIAAGKFDPSHGVKFISYAVWWIRQSILAAIARHGRAVRVPLNRTADLSRVVRLSASLRLSLGREPTADELSRESGLSVEVIRALLALNVAEVRLDAPLAPGSERAAVDRLMIDGQRDAEAEVLDHLLTDEIDAALGTLPARDARVLKLYFGLDGDREHTLDEIGAVLGVTRERARQLRDRALRRLRDGTAGRALASYAA